MSVNININGKSIEETFPSVTLEDSQTIFKELTTSPGPQKAVIRTYMREDWSHEWKMVALCMLATPELVEAMAIQAVITGHKNRKEPK